MRSCNTVRFLAEQEGTNNLDFLRIMDYHKMPLEKEKPNENKMKYTASFIICHSPYTPQKEAVYGDFQ